MSEVLERLARLSGAICWGSHWDCDTGFRLNFGDPHLEVYEPLTPRPDRPLRARNIFRSAIARGQWEFWVSAGSRWKASFPDIDPVTTSASYRRMMMAEARLDGQRFVSASVDESTGATRLVFDTSTVLEIRRPSRGYEWQLWSLYDPDGFGLEVHGDGTYGVGPMDTNLVLRPMKG